MYDRPTRQAVNGAEKAIVVVKQVAPPPVTSVPWEIYDASLMRMECDSGAQRSFFRTVEFDSGGSKQFGPLVVGSNQYGLVSRLLESIPADEIKDM